MSVDLHPASTAARPVDPSPPGGPPGLPSSEYSDPARLGALLEPHDIPAMVDRVGAVAAEKAGHPASHFVRSLLGGVFVAFGVLLSLSVSAGIETPGLRALVMGLAFGPSFVLILVSGVSLITADMAAGLVLLVGGRLGVGAYLRFLALGLTGNLAGSAAFIAVAALAGGPYLSPAIASNAVAVGVAKSGESPGSAILLAVLCTWFLQSAMFLFFKARTDIARMGFAFYGPFAFVAAGTQHVIANIAFVAFPWMLHALHPAQVPATPITLGFGEHGLLLNLVTTTFGNFVGGALLVALPFAVVARLLRSDR